MLPSRFGLRCLVGVFSCASFLIAVPAFPEEEQNPGALTMPVEVTSCQPNPPTYNRYGRMSSHGSLTVQFVDHRPVAATEVSFGLLARGVMVARVKDVGTFSPGVQVRHSYTISNQVFPLGTSFARCVPLRAKFSDGVLWQNPSRPRT